MFNKTSLEVYKCTARYFKKSSANFIRYIRNVLKEIDGSVTNRI